MYGCKTEFDWDNVSGSGPSVLKTYQGPCPTWEWGEEFCLIGFWVAVGGSGRVGLPYLTSFALAQPYELYGDQLDVVKERWGLFTTWCAEQGHVLSEPELFLMETETA